MKQKRISLTECVVGEKYHVVCGIWDFTDVIYCGTQERGSRTYYAFTTGNSVDAFEKSWNVVSTRNRLRVYAS